MSDAHCIFFTVHSPERPPNPDVARVYARYFAGRQGRAVPDEAEEIIRPYPDGSGRYRVEAPTEAAT
ncbi:hypothetical protein EAO70_05945 [Streptomyces sp. adm13(2018)]|uniref:hypothetical protein n=1 Tax=Streptomyces sp. adm13(2018) TaxID=2479007 RepID=UPI0011CE37EC|nr:hypothetical protein [Streptomyces sp. adm13(2018)]TXS22400.1 hypothetical protein EAO70_05945 [Streptomyces sp. adm13(2018)]